MRCFLNSLIATCALLVLAACSQAGNPTQSGAALAGAGGGNGSTSTLATVLISSGSTLAQRFPTMARLQLSVTGPVGSSGVPRQLNLPIGGQSVPLLLPFGVPLVFTFDLFDAAGIYLASGTTTQTLLADGGLVIPVNVRAVAPGVSYVDPLTGLAGSGPVLSLTVSVSTGASQQPVAGAVVSLGASGAVTAVTDASGIASFNSVPLPQDVHVFANGDAVSVLGFQGTALAVPMPERTPQPATISINPPAGPTLAAGELLDVYLSDGMTVQGIGGMIGDSAAVRSHRALMPMRGPVGISAIVENPLDISPRPDLGFLAASVPAGHHILAPVNAAIADPAVQPRLTPLLLTLSVPPVSGLLPLAHVRADVFAVGAGGWYQLVSHKDNQLLPPNRRDISIWPVAANSFMLHALASDTYAESEVWQRAPLASALSAPAAWPPVPAVTAASAVSLAWADSAPHAWDGYVAELQQGAHLWRLFSFQPGLALSLPSVPPAAVSPLLAGFATDALVREYRLDPAAGFSSMSPDLWYLPRMLSERASSASLTFIP